MRLSATLSMLLAVSLAPILVGCHCGRSGKLIDNQVEPCNNTWEPPQLGLLQRIRFHNQRFVGISSSVQDCDCVSEEVAVGNLISASAPETSNSSELITVNSDPSYDTAPYESVGSDAESEPKSVLENPNRYLVPDLPSKIRRSVLINKKSNPQTESQDSKWLVQQDADQVESDTTPVDQELPNYVIPVIDDPYESAEIESLDSNSTDDDQKSSRKTVPNDNENSPALLNEESQPADILKLPEAGSPPVSSAGPKNYEPTRQDRSDLTPAFESNKAEEAYLTEPFDSPVIDENTSGRISKPVMSRPLSQGPNEQAANDPVVEVEEPIVLKARPTGNHYSRPIQYAPNRPLNRNPHLQPSYQFERPPRRASVPARRANFSQTRMPSEVSLDAESFANQPIEFRALPAIDLPSLTKVSEARQQFGNLRAESDFEKEKQRLLDIQAIVKYEIDRRIESGALVPRTEEQQESVQIQPIMVPLPIPVPTIEPSRQLGDPQTKLQRVTPKAAEKRFENHFTPYPSEAHSLAGEPQVCLPRRNPYIPILAFDTFGSTEQFADAYPNLFVPVLELADPSGKEDGASESTPGSKNRGRFRNRSEIGTIELNLDETPMPRMATENNQTGISELDENAELIRLRAYARKADTKNDTTARFRNVSTQYRYLSGDEKAPQQQQQPAVPTEIIAPVIEIPKIRAEPIYIQEKHERAVLGLSNLKKPAESQAKIRIIER